MLDAGASWVSAQEFAELACINRHNARRALSRCHSGGTWHDIPLTVRLLEGTKGGGGKAYQVAALSLPPELRQAWQDRHPELFSQPEVSVAAPPVNLQETPDPTKAKAWADAQWKLETLWPALTKRRNSAARGEEIRGIASRQHRHPDGEFKTVTERWCRDWIERYEAAERQEKGSGINALIRKERTDKGDTRIVVNRAWNTACPLPLKAKSAIAAELEAYVASLWANGTPTWRRVEALASAKLLELSRAAGWVEASFDACTAGRHLVEKFREYQTVAIHDQDAKRFHDLYLPRVQKTRDGLLPMDIVVGDVHPVDILVTRTDGSRATVRAISWLDLATYRLHTTLILLNPREGVKQTHVAQAFIAMVKAWGLPRMLYLDNGSEYSWEDMMEGFRELTGMVAAFYRAPTFHIEIVDTNLVADALAEDDLLAGSGIETGIGGASPDRDAVIRAQPYNASAKAIEGVFGILERTIFPMVAGYIGGNRMAKKTHNVGKEPTPFPGGFDSYHSAFETAVDFYHRQKQSDGSSPFEKLDTAVTAGWLSVKAPEMALFLAMAREEQIQVRHAGITVNDATYWHDDLVKVMQKKVFVRHAKHDPSLIYFTNHANKWVAAAKGPRFRALDPAGAKEKARRVKLSKAHVNELRSNTSRLDLVEEMGKFNALTPNPATPFGPEISLSPEMQELADAKAQLGKAPDRPALPPGKVFDESSGKVVDMFPTPPPADDEIEGLPSLEEFWLDQGRRAANGDE
jgi:hypothetical protein